MVFSVCSPSGQVYLNERHLRGPPQRLWFTSPTSDNKVKEGEGMKKDEEGKGEKERRKRKENWK